MNTNTICGIPREEYLERVQRVQEEMKKEGLDAIIAFGHAAEPQYLRYFADFRVSFETGGVAIPAVGDAALLIGPETLERAQMSNPLRHTFKMLAMRELAAPRYEDPTADTFEELFKRFQQDRPLKKVGVAGWRLVPMDLFREMENALRLISPQAEWVPADGVVDCVRAQKSAAELKLIRKSAQIARQTLEYVISQLRVGMTGEQLRGIALGKMIELGAEDEAFPIWITRQEQTEFAINLSCKEAFQPGDLVQIQIGASVQGYCSACGRPVVLGRADSATRGLIEACIAAKRAAESALATARTSSEVAREHREAVVALGREDSLVYGPCHGVGLVECEAPWIELGADFPLKPGMAFCADIFLQDRSLHRGVRYEDMLLITEDGIERLTGMTDEVLEILPDAMG